MKRLGERARVVESVRRFFGSRGFLEVQTPVLVPSPGLDLHLDAYAAGDPEPGRARWLITSPEYQMKRLLGDGYGSIYQLVPCFRRGERGERHNPEFTMLEWYRAPASIVDVMRDTEQLVARALDGAARLGARTVDVHPPLERLTVCDAFARYAGWAESETLATAAVEPERYFRALIEQVEPALERLDRGVFLHEYPASQASLARRKPDDPRVCERFELYVAGMELCNGFGELVDPNEQRRRLVADQDARRAQQRPVYPIDERFLEALGRIPPCAGNALGLDRLVALACGTTAIAEVLAFADDDL